MSRPCQRSSVSGRSTSSSASFDAEERASSAIPPSQADEDQVEHPQGHKPAERSRIGSNSAERWLGKSRPGNLTAPWRQIHLICAGTIRDRQKAAGRAERKSECDSADPYG